MATYADADDVRARVPHRTISATSKPTSTQVEGYITTGEAMLLSALGASDCGLPEATDDGGVIIGSWITGYAEGRLRMAYAATDADGDNDDGKDLITKFEDLIKDIKNNGSWYDAYLNGAAGSESRQMRSYVLDNDDDKTIDDGDFDPEFETDEVF